MKSQKIKNLRPKYLRIYEHNLVPEILFNYNKVSNFISDQSKHAYKLGEKPEISFTIEMAYHHNVNYYLSRLLETVERIEQVTVFLGRFPNSSYFNENNINLYKWINYHYSNFLIMSISLCDIALLLTNEIFLLKIEPVNCKLREVVKHKPIQEAGVKTALENLYAETKKYRTERNLFAHQGQAPKLGFMDTLEIYEHLERTEKLLRKRRKKLKPADYLDNPLLSQRVRLDMFRSERKKLIVEINKEINVYIDLLHDLFNVQKPFYDLVTTRLKSLNP